MFCLLMCVFFCRNAPICQNLAMFSLSSKSNSCDDTTTHGVHLPWDLWGPTWWLLGDQPQNNNNISIFCQPQPLCICLHWLIFPAENTVFSTLFLMVVEWQKCGYYFTVLIATSASASWPLRPKWAWLNFLPLIVIMKIQRKSSRFFCDHQDGAAVFLLPSHCRRGESSAAFLPPFI